MQAMLCRLLMCTVTTTFHLLLRYVSDKELLHKKSQSLKHNAKGVAGDKTHTINYTQ